MNTFSAVQTSKNTGSCKKGEFMNFADALRENASYTKTENGALALNTTNSACLDFFSLVGALRDADEQRIQRLFADAFAEDPLMAVKITFYGRDIRGGLGERKTFRTIIRYMAEYHPDVVRKNIHLIGEYGRYDDLYALCGTPVDKDMWEYMKKRLDADIAALREGKPVSLLAKWIATPDASSKKTRTLGIWTARELGYEIPEFKRILRALRKAVKIVERDMSANRWNEIEYPSVPSRAMHNYGKAFKRHDQERFNSFINKAVNGEVKINASTLYPYDLVCKIYRSTSFFGKMDILDEKTVEAQWRALPNYVRDGVNALVIADTSGSMERNECRPLFTALSLAVYFAERNTGAYHNLWMTFSNRSDIQTLKGETLAQKLRSIDMNNWGNSTNLESAFRKILDIAVKNHVPQEEMPKSLIVISDMEINKCMCKDWLFYDAMVAQFAAYGYTLPNVVFWNVYSHKDTFHADKSRKGVQLVSGSSAATFGHVMECIGMTPIETMKKIINSERYAPITV